MEMRDIYRKYRLDNSRIFHDGEIPERKLSNALNAYAKEIVPDEVLILIDDTVFGGAKEGMLLSKKGLHSHSKFEQPRFIEISQIERIWSQKRTLYINNEIFYRFDILDERYIKELCSYLSEIIKNLQGTEAVIKDADVYASSNTITNIKQSTIKSILNIKFDSDRIYKFPNIPNDKSINAIDSYARSVNIKDIIILYDDTIFKNAQDGFIVTEECIYMHESYSQPIIMKYNEVKNFSMDRKGCLIINNREQIYKPSFLSSSDIKKILQIVQNFVPRKNNFEEE